MLWLRRAASTALLVAGAGATYQYQRDEGTRRSVTFWKEAFPIYLHYRYVEVTTAKQTAEEQSRAFNKLHDMYAPRSEQLVLELRGYYLKQAQFFSTVDEQIPKQYLDFCKRMQSEVPTQFAKGEAEELVRTSLGLDRLDEVFCEFGAEPIGSASIGQVHVARLASRPATQVAVKVMGKGVEERFRADIATLLSFCRLAMPQFVAPMLEVQKQFETEFDYLLEAENLKCVGNNLAPVFASRVFVPQPIMELCRKQVLVMEYVPGPTLLRGITQNFEAYARSQGTTLDALQHELLERMRRPDFEYRSLDDESRRVQLYDAMVRAKDLVRNVPVALYNGTLGWFVAPKPYSKSPQLLDLGAIIKLLCEVHAHEVLVNGAFSCDCHPGNVLLMPDGRLGLIDFGQFKRISNESRLLMARAIVGLAHGDEIDVVRTMARTGTRTKYGNPEVGFRLTAFWFDRSSKDIVGDRNAQQFLTEMELADPSLSLAEDFIMIGRVSVMMRAVGNAFGLGVSVAKLWEPTAREVLRQSHVDYVPKRTRIQDYYTA